MHGGGGALLFCPRFSGDQLEGLLVDPLCVRELVRPEAAQDDDVHEPDEPIADDCVDDCALHGVPPGVALRKLERVTVAVNIVAGKDDPEDESHSADCVADSSTDGGLDVEEGEVEDGEQG